MVWALGAQIARRFFAVSHVEGVVAGFTAAQSNTVLVGIPLILEAYGPEGAVPLFLLVAIHLPIMMTAATVLAEGRGVPLRRIVRQLVMNPLLIAIAVSVLAHQVGAPLPGALKTIVDMLGAAAGPCALFAMGIALRRYGAGDEPLLSVALTALKLVVHPLVVLVLATRVFTMPNVWAGVAVLFADALRGERLSVRRALSHRRGHLVRRDRDLDGAVRAELRLLAGRHGDPMKPSRRRTSSALTPSARSARRAVEPSDLESLRPSGPSSRA